MLWSDEKSKNQKNLWRSKKLLSFKNAGKLAFIQQNFNAATSLSKKVYKIKVIVLKI